MTNRIRAARRTTILPGVESLIVEEQSRARSTVAEAVKQLYDMKRIRPNDTIVAISGSPSYLGKNLDHSTAFHQRARRVVRFGMKRCSINDTGPLCSEVIASLV